MAELAGLSDLYREVYTRYSGKSHPGIRGSGRFIEDVERYRRSPPMAEEVQRMRFRHPDWDEEGLPAIAKGAEKFMFLMIRWASDATGMEPLPDREPDQEAR